MTELSKLAEEIVKEIEREDFYYAVKRYFHFEKAMFLKLLHKIWDDYL